MMSYTLQQPTAWRLFDFPTPQAEKKTGGLSTSSFLVAGDEGPVRPGVHGANLSSRTARRSARTMPAHPNKQEEWRYPLVG